MEGSRGVQTCQGIACKFIHVYSNVTNVVGIFDFFKCTVILIIHPL